MRQRARLGPLLAVILGIGLFAPRAQADQKVTTILSAVTVDGVSSTVSFVGAGENATYAFQVVFTGTATPTLEASLDGTNFMAAVATWDVTKKIITGPVIGGMSYRVRVADCSGCSVTAKVTMSGGGQVVTY